jgi:hypothetical protein
MIGGKAGRLAMRIVFGLLAGTLLAVAIALVVFRDRTPDLTEAGLDAAERRWQERGPQSYDMDLVIEGNRPGPVHVEVRRGQVTHMTRDGVEPKQRRTWAVWAVEGLFETIRQELDKTADPAEGFQTAPGSRMVQRAEFDPQYGYPAKYRRLVLGSNLELRWDVTRFVPLESVADGPAATPLDETDRGKME